MDCKTPPPGFDPRYITPPPYTDRPAKDFNALAIDISGKCNLACNYCSEIASQPVRPAMSPETLEAAWQFLFPKDTDRKDFSIHLGSGEPFLNFPLLEKTAKLVEQTKAERNVDIRVFLTTNATLIDDEMLEWLIATDWEIKISLDGPAVIHDKWRVLPGGGGTYDRVAKVLTHLVERIPDRVIACTVLSRGNDPAEVFAAVEKSGVRKVEMVPVAHADESLRLKAEDIERFRKFIKNYAARYLEEDVEANPPTIICRFRQCMMRLMGYQLARVYCAAGDSYLAVSPQGELYPCARFIGLDQYKVGHVGTGLDPEAEEKFRHEVARPYERRETCCQCWAAPLCSGPCYAFAEVFGPGDGKPIDYHCDFIRAIAEAAVFLYYQLKEKNPERLLFFLPGIDDIL